ncbi:MAG: hypothetical protein ACRDWD_05265 [Acidimicrobiia bacterium]
MAWKLIMRLATGVAIGTGALLITFGGTATAESSDAGEGMVGDDVTLVVSADPTLAGSPDLVAEELVVVELVVLDAIPAVAE